MCATTIRAAELKAETSPGALTSNNNLRTCPTWLRRNVFCMAGGKITHRTTFEPVRLIRRARSDQEKVVDSTST